jgi:hypothetical protein
MDAGAQRTAGRADAPIACVRLIGSTYLMVGILALFLTGTGEGRETGDRLFAFQVSVGYGLAALAIGLVWIGAGASLRPARALTWLSVPLFLAWGVAGVAVDGDGLLSGAAANVALSFAAAAVAIGASLLDEGGVDRLVRWARLVAATAARGARALARGAARAARPLRRRSWGAPGPRP